MPEAGCKELVRIGIAARLLGRSTRTLVNWTAAGKLRAFRDANGHRYFDLDEIRRLAPKPEGRVPESGAPSS